MQENFESDWTLDAFKRRDDERRRHEANEGARAPATLVSEWARAARKFQEDERRESEETAPPVVAKVEPKLGETVSTAGDLKLDAPVRPENERRKNDAIGAPPLSQEILLSDWTLDAYSRREDAQRRRETPRIVMPEAKPYRQELHVGEPTLDARRRAEVERRRSEAAETAPRAAERVTRRTGEILVSDWTLAAYKDREDARRRRETLRIVMPEAKPQRQELHVGEPTLEARGHAEIERRKIEADETAPRAAEQVKQRADAILVSDWTPAAYTAREEARRKAQAVAAPAIASTETPPPAAEQRASQRPADILLSDRTLAAYKGREEERRKSAVAATGATILAREGGTEERRKTQTPPAAGPALERPPWAPTHAPAGDRAPAGFRTVEAESPRKQEVDATLAELARLVEADEGAPRVPPKAQGARLPSPPEDPKAAARRDFPIAAPPADIPPAASTLETRRPLGEAAAPPKTPPTQAAAQGRPAPRRRPPENRSPTSRRFGGASALRMSRRTAYLLAAAVVLALGGLAAGLNWRSGAFEDAAEIAPAATPPEAPRPQLGAAGDEATSREAFVPEPAPQAPTPAAVEKAGPATEMARAPQEAPGAGAAESVQPPATERPEPPAAPPPAPESAEQPSAAAAAAGQERIWTVTISPDGGIVRKGEMLPAPPAPRPAVATSAAPTDASGQPEPAAKSAAPDGSREAGAPAPTAGKPKARAASDAAKPRPPRAAAAAPEVAPADSGSLGFIGRAAESIGDALKGLGRGGSPPRP